jgi:hypothetical protein
MDFHSVAIDFRHHASPARFPVPEIILARSLHGCELPDIDKQPSCAARGGAYSAQRILRHLVVATHKMHLENLFSSASSKLDCLQSGTRSFCSPTDAYPVGVQLPNPSEMPP